MSKYPFFKKKLLERKKKSKENDTLTKNILPKTPSFFDNLQNSNQDQHYAQSLAHTNPTFHVTLTLFVQFKITTFPPNYAK